MKTTFLIAALLFSTATLLDARAEPADLDGPIDCSHWTAARTAKDAQVFEAYFAGTLSGMSLATGVEVWKADGKEISRDSTYQWADRYCREYPEDLVTRAAAAFFNERSEAK